MTDPQAIVFVVDDDMAVRQALSLLLDSVGLRSQCYASASEFLEALDEDWRGCLLLDVRIPGMSGLELQERLGEMRSTLPVIFLTGHADVSLAVRAMQSGAFDFLEKPFNDQELLDRVHAALAREAHRRREQGERRDVLQRLGRLTRREHEVMRLVVEGLPNKTIADRLGISERTVEIHRARVMDKTQAESLAHLVRMWMLTRD